MCTRRCSQACLGQCRHRHTNLRLLSARTFRDSDVVSVLSFQSHLPVVRTVAMVHHRVIYFLSSLSSLLLLLLLLSPPCLWLFICSACTALDSCLPLAFFLLLLSFFFPFPFSLFSFFFFSSFLLVVTRTSRHDVPMVQQRANSVRPSCPRENSSFSRASCPGRAPVWVPDSSSLLPTKTPLLPGALLGLGSSLLFHLSWTSRHDALQ
ncbi:unnamed protein product [Penicillium olsonii]|nr:unnamed protein product [Penicillium olsonii]